MTRNTDPEAEPLLDRAPQGAASVKTRSRSAKVIRHVSTWSTLYLCGLFAFLIDYPIFMSDAAKIRMLELGLCRDYYRLADASVIGGDGNIPEELCKVKPVQSSLARLRGFLQMLEYLISIILAVPFGILADKWGRKTISAVGIIGAILGNAWYFTTLYFYEVFPTPAVYAAPVFVLIGAGPVVIPAMILAIIAHVSPKKVRTPAIFYCNVGIMSSELIAPPLGSFLTGRIGPHFTFLVGIPLFTFSLVVLYFIRDEEPKYTGHSNLEDCESTCLSPESDDTSSGHEDSYETSLDGGISGKRKGALADALRFVREDVGALLVRAGVLAGLASLAVHRVARPLLELTLQYMSVRFGWPLRNANLLISVQAGVQIPIFLFVMPLIYQFLLLRSKGDTLLANLTQAKFCLAFLLAGTFGMVWSPLAPAFITFFIVYTFGNGFSAIMRSLLTSFVPQSHFALLFTTMALFEGVISLVAPLLFGLSFSFGIEKGGVAIALPYFVAFVLYCVASVGVWTIKKSQTREDPDILD